MDQNNPLFKEFRSNQVRQMALNELLQNENFQTALALISKETRLPAIALDAGDIVSVRAAALTRGSERVIDMLYLMATPWHEPLSIPESTYGANPNDLKETEEQ